MAITEGPAFAGDPLPDPPGSATTYHCAIPSPQYCASPGAGDSSPPATPGPPVPAEPRWRVLVVEDHELNRTLLAEYLAARGFEVATAEGGTQALTQTVDWNPDAIILDIQMPELDGLEVCRRIREMPDPGRARVPILALTALAMPGDRERCLAAGVTDYLTKPFTLKELARLLREMVSPGKPAAG